MHKEARDGKNGREKTVATWSPGWTRRHRAQEGLSGVGTWPQGPVSTKDGAKPCRKAFRPGYF